MHFYHAYTLALNIAYAYTYRHTFTVFARMRIVSYRNNGPQLHRIQTKENYIEVKREREFLVLHSLIYSPHYFVVVVVVFCMFVLFLFLFDAFSFYWYVLLFIVSFYFPERVTRMWHFFPSVILLYASIYMHFLSFSFILLFFHILRKRCSRKSKRDFDYHDY